MMWWIRVVDRVKRFTLTAVAVVVGVGGTTQPARAFDFSWSGLAILSNNWGDRGNWDFALSPPLNGPNDRVIFNSGGPGARYHPNLESDYTVNALLFTLDPVWGPAEFSFESSTGRVLTIGSGGITNGAHRTQTIHHPVSIAAAQTWSADTGDLVFNGARFGSGALTVSSSPTHKVVFSSFLSTHNGPITVSAGELFLAATSTIHSGSTVTVNSGARVTYQGFELQSIGSLAGSGVFDMAAGDLSVGHNEASTTFSGALGGGFPSVFSKFGGGTQTLSGSAGGTFFFGNYLVAEGILRLTGGFKMNQVNLVQVNPGAVWDLDNTSQDIRQLQGEALGGLVIIGAGSLRVGEFQTTLLTNYRGALEGTGQFIKAGPNTHGLHGNSPNFTGDVRVEGGTLEFPAGTIAPSSTQVDSGATLRVNGGAVNNSGALSNAGAVQLSAGSLRAATIHHNLGGTFSFTGGTLSVDTFNGDLTQAGGAIAPGQSPGVTQVNGHYQITNPAAVVQIELAGTGEPGSVNGYDQLSITGTASLAGTLDIHLINGLSHANLNHGDLFEILTADTITGMFDAFTGDVFDLGDNKALVPVRLERIADGVEVLALVTAAPGDANLDGKVSFADFARLQNHFDLTGQTWQDGNFNPNVDDRVGFADFAVLQNNLGVAFFDPAQVFAGYNVLPLEISQSGLRSSVAAVPEPGTIAVLGLGGLAIIARRRRAGPSCLSNRGSLDTAA